MSVHPQHNIILKYKMHLMDHFNPFITEPQAIFLPCENDNLGIIN